jgi:hypothetical protein
MVLVGSAFGASFQNSGALGMLGNPNCQVCHDAFLLQRVTEGNLPSAVCLNRHFLTTALRKLQGDIGLTAPGTNCTKYET